jgi:hypothetical protein
LENWNLRLLSPVADILSGLVEIDPSFLKIEVCDRTGMLVLFFYLHLSGQRRLDKRILEIAEIAKTVLGDGLCQS